MISLKRTKGYARGFIGYDTYLFKDKDPVIDILRCLVAESCGNAPITAELRKVAEATGVSFSTLHSWFYGKTTRPQHATIEAVARYYGRTFNVPAVYRPTKAILKVVGGREA